MDTNFQDPFERLERLESWATNASKLIQQGGEQLMTHADNHRQLSDGMVEIARAVDTLIKEVSRLNRKVQNLENENKKL